MGLLVNGVWKDQWYETDKSEGRFERQDSGFRSWITKDGSPGLTGEGGFKAEAGRYHLYVSHACPWAHRAMIFRALKGLEDLIPVSVVHFLMREDGWTFNEGPGVVADPIFDVDKLWKVYVEAKPDYSGRVTVPILWDKEKATIVNNESSEIIRMLNSAFDDVGAKPGDYYPEALRREIDVINERVYETLNNGVYKCGFATTQTAYEEALHPLSETLAWLEDMLSKKRYLLGDVITEADWRLFTTMVRYDPVYVGHFKCNLKRLVDLPNLFGYIRELFQVSGVRETVHMDHIKNHYYMSHETVNPTAVVPLGPLIDYEAPHGRGG